MYLGHSQKPKALSECHLCEWDIGSYKQPKPHIARHIYPNMVEESVYGLS